MVVITVGRTDCERWRRWAERCDWVGFESHRSLPSLLFCQVKSGVTNRQPHTRLPSSAKAPGGIQANQTVCYLSLAMTGNRKAVQAARQYDWIELTATVLLSLATIVAAWSAYQSTRWNGIQTYRFSLAAAKRVEATQHSAALARQVQLDLTTWLSYLEQRQAGNESGAQFIRDRMRDEFKPAFDAWLALAPDGGIPPDTPLDVPQYQPKSKASLERLNSEADTLAVAATEANQIGDNYVLVAVIMASVLFFAGVGTKVWGQSARLVLLSIGIALYLGGTWFMLTLPVSFGI